MREAVANHSRRSFVRGASSAAAAAIFAPEALAKPRRRRASKASLFRNGSFPDGVLSGDPTVSGITLWSRIEGVEGAGSVRLEVAKDRSFNRIVASTTIGTSESSGHTVKARVKGLAPHERYYYRFESGNTSSNVGRFQTALPSDSRQPVRFAYFSCQDYAHGYYNAHELLAKEDIDFVVNLGDYIYADRQHPLLYDKPVRVDPIEQARTLDQYRAKYRLCRQDTALRKMHAQFPMISVWDDHEIKNNFVGTMPGYLDVSKEMLANGYRAFFENMPLFTDGKNRLYQSLRFGKTVELIMLDERQYRDPQPCNDSNLASEATCSELNDPRKMLGNKQLQFLKNRLLQSQATWKLIGNPLMMMPVKFGESVYGVDLWSGYSQEKREIIELIRTQNIEDVVFLSGDNHVFVAGEVWDQDSRPVAPELVGGSITSSSLGELKIKVTDTFSLEGNDENPQTPEALIGYLKSSNPWVDEADTDHHGYSLVTADPYGCTVTFRMLKTIKRRSTETLDDLTYLVERGRPKLIPA